MAMNIIKKDNIITFGLARFTVITPECIRLEFSKSGTFTDQKSLFAVGRDASQVDFELTQNDKQLVIDTGKIRMEYTYDGFPFHENIKAFIKKGNETLMWRPSDKNSCNLGGSTATLDGVGGPIRLDDGILSKNGWYLIDDSATHLLENDWAIERPKDNGTDWYLFGYGYNYKSALRALTNIGGAIPMPRKYILGSWYSRWWPYTSDDIRTIVKEYDENDFPLDIMVIDMDWHWNDWTAEIGDGSPRACFGMGWATNLGWTGYSWNTKLFPDAKKLLGELHDQGIFVTLNDHPADGIRDHEDTYEEFMKDMGIEPSKGENLLFDAGDKKYMDKFFKHAHEPLEKEGVDFWWLDWQQDLLVPSTRSIPGLTHIRWLNYLYYQHSMQNNKRGLSFSRWGGLGDHRHPIYFSGDSQATWNTLAFEIAFTATSGNVGCFFWSHDIGGFYGERNPELYARWVQFGFTSAAMRIHSVREEELDRRPWKWGEQAIESMRIMFHLRSQFIPYIYSSVRQCHVQSVPLNRPMYIEYPENAMAYKNPQQYFFGDAFLAAPITTPGIGASKTAQQSVWFPEGTWYNWFTGECYMGELDALVCAGINEFPLFVKAGIPVPLQPYTSRMTTEPLRELIIRCFPGEDEVNGVFSLYEDDGVTRDYATGSYAETQLSYMRAGNCITIEVGATQGSFAGQVEDRSYVICLPCTAKAKNAKVNGRITDVEYDCETYTNFIRIPTQSIRQSIKIEVFASEASREEISEKAALNRAEAILGFDLKGESLKNMIIKSMKESPESETAQALLALAGIGLQKKNEALYLFEGVEKLLFYGNKELIDENTIKFKVKDQSGQEIKNVLDFSLNTHGNYPVVLPEVPENSTVSVEFTMQGNKMMLV